MQSLGMMRRASGQPAPRGPPPALAGGDAWQTGSDSRTGTAGHPEDTDTLTCSRRQARRIKNHTAAVKQGETLQGTTERSSEFRWVEGITLVHKPRRKRYGY